MRGFQIGDRIPLKGDVEGRYTLYAVAFLAEGVLCSSELERREVNFPLFVAWDKVELPRAKPGVFYTNGTYHRIGTAEGDLTYRLFRGGVSDWTRIPFDPSVWKEVS